MLTTERTILRPWRDDDLDAFAELNADPEVMRFFPRIQSREESAAAIERFQAHIDRHGYGFWALEDQASETCIGMLGLANTPDSLPVAPSIEIGWRLARRWWGQGLAPEAATECLRYAFTVLDLDQVVSFTATRNSPSRRVMEKIGLIRRPEWDFEHPGVAASTGLRDHVVYTIRRGEYTANRFS